MAASAQNVQAVFNATSECKTVEEIAKSTSLDENTVRECITTLKGIGVVAEDAFGRVCNYNAVCSLKDQFDKIRKLND